MKIDMRFDSGEFERNLKRAADEVVQKQLERMLAAMKKVKQQMGAQGPRIVIPAKAVRKGDEYEFAPTFPDEATASEFMRRYKAEMR